MLILAAMIESIANRLERRTPLLYRIAQPPWRVLMRALGRPGYWESRRRYRYYGEVIRLARESVPAGGAVIDVGANETEVLRQLDWFSRRVALDIRHFRGERDIERVTIDFLHYTPESRFDLVLCLQVLEHLDDPAAFARRLFEIGRTVVITVPYRWPQGTIKGHLQDPVDEAKLRAWTQREPQSSSVVTDKRERLVALYTNP